MVTVTGARCPTVLICSYFWATISRELLIDCRLQNGGSDSHTNPVFARTFVVFVRRTLTGDGNAIADSNTVFVVCWVRVARISNEHTLRIKSEFEGFVLGTLCDSLAIRQVRENVVVTGHSISTRHSGGAPHPSGGTKNRWC